MKIVWISHSSSLHGAERCFYEGIKSLHDKGVEVHAVFPQKGPLIDFCADYIKSYASIYAPWWGKVGQKASFNERYQKLKANWRAADKLQKWLIEVDPDLVVTNTLVMPFGAIAAYRAKITHVWYIHEFGREDHRIFFDWGNYFSCKFIQALSKRVVVNSRAVQNKFEHYIPASMIDCINYAVDVENNNKRLHSASCDDDCLRMVLLGWIAKGKRQEDAVRAVSVLRKRGYKVGLEIVGEGEAPYKKYLKSLVDELGLKENEDVKFIDFTPYPIDHMINSDIILMCSVSEAFGRVTIEAMKCARAVIGANAGATPTLIQNGYNGLLYKAKDYKDLASKIQILCDNKEVLKKVGNNAYHWAMSNFSLKKYGDALLSVFEKALL